MLSVYTLAFACTLLTAATLGGRLGRRRLFIVAMVAFTVTSVLCGLARSPLELIICRGAQGMSAALMSAQTLALIAALFPKSRHGMVFGIYGAVAGLAAMLGPVLGGLLVTGDLFGWGWRAIFFVNVPIGVLACVLAARRLPRMRDDSSPRLDLVGVALSTAGLFLLLYPLAVGREQGWPPRLWAMMGAAIILLGLFVVAEHRLLELDGQVGKCDVDDRGVEHLHEKSEQTSCQCKPCSTGRRVGRLARGHHRRGVGRHEATSDQFACENCG